eukprot:1140641-Pelagomonas_calceolata.AAC.6
MTKLTRVTGTGKPRGRRPWCKDTVCGNIPDIGRPGPAAFEPWTTGNGPDHFLGRRLSRGLIGKHPQCMLDPILIQAMHIQS